MNGIGPACGLWPLRAKWHVACPARPGSYPTTASNGRSPGADPATTTLVIVARPDAGALREAERTHGELAALGVRNQHLVINGVFRAGSSTDAIASAMAVRADKALSLMPVGLTCLPRTVIPLAPSGLVGIAALRAIGAQREVADVPDGGVPAPELSALGKLIDDLARHGHGVILTMGKGGVGKTTVAAAVAIALADRGFPVHLSTTDPAAHVAETLNSPLKKDQSSLGVGA